MASIRMVLTCGCSGQIVVSPTNIFHLFNNTTKLVEAMALANNTQLPSQMVSMTVQASHQAMRSQLAVLLMVRYLLASSAGMAGGS